MNLVAVSQFRSLFFFDLANAGACFIFVSASKASSTTSNLASDALECSSGGAVLQWIEGLARQPLSFTMPCFELVGDS